MYESVDAVVLRFHDGDLIVPRIVANLAPFVRDALGSDISMRESGVMCAAAAHMFGVLAYDPDSRDFPNDVAHAFGFFESRAAIYMMSLVAFIFANGVDEPLIRKGAQVRLVPRLAKILDEEPEFEWQSIAMSDDVNADDVAQLFDALGNAWAGRDFVEPSGAWLRHFGTDALFPQRGLPILEAAAASGSVDRIKWACEHGNAALTTTVCAAAARGGHLQALKALRAIGCPWDLLTTIWAASHGHVDCFTWALDNGCPWDTVRTAWAASRGFAEVVRHAAHSGYADGSVGVRADAAGHHDIANWLRINGSC